MLTPTRHQLVVANSVSKSRSKVFKPKSRQQERQPMRLDSAMEACVRLTHHLIAELRKKANQVLRLAIVMSNQSLRSLTNRDSHLCSYNHLLIHQMCLVWRAFNLVATIAHRHGSKRQTIYLKGIPVSSPSLGLMDECPNTVMQVKERPKTNPCQC